MDFRAPRVGLVGCEVLTAGEAGIVLSRFLVSVEVAAVPVLVAVADGRTVLGVLETVEGRATVVVERDDEASPRVLNGFLSVAVELPTVVRLDAGATEVLLSVAFVNADGANDARFAAPDSIGLLFSAEGLEGPFFGSSMELVDGRDLCAEVGVVEVTGGRRTVEVTGGRVGGLFKLLPSTERLEADATVFGAPVVVAAAGRFAEVNGRLGGMAVFLSGAVVEAVSSSCLAGSSTSVVSVCSLTVVRGTSSGGPSSGTTV